MTHSECVKKLIEIGNRFDFHATGRSYGKMYHMGNPDCVWYLDCAGKPPLIKIMRGDRCKCSMCKKQKKLYMPVVAFEVPFSEKQKALRGTIATLQVTNAAASIVVLLGASAKYKSYLNKLIGRYSATRFRVWTKKDVNQLYNKTVNKV